MYYGSVAAGVLLLPLVVYILVNIIIAKRMEYTAKLKGYESTRDVFWMVFFFNVIGVLYAVALPDLYGRTAPKKNSLAEDEPSSTSSANSHKDLPKI